MKETIIKYNIKAKKSLGQNFLINENILDKIVNSIIISWENVIEIWAWFWVLTEKIISKNPKSLSIVEIDKNMINIIKQRIDNNEININQINNFKIYNEDILKHETNYKNNDYIIIANIPYYITSPILFKFLYQSKNKPKKMLIMMQSDVAEKIIKWQDNKFFKSSVLSLYIWKKSFVKKIVFVEKNNFYPSPKVDSEILLFELFDKYKEVNDKEFINFIKIWFSNPRKKLINNLEKWWIKKEALANVFNILKINLNIRWEDLNLDSWINLYLQLKKMKEIRF